MLTTYQPSAGAGGLSAKYVVSGKTFKSTVLGTDAAAGLALLQLQGGDGRVFPTVTVGNYDTLVASTYVSKQLSYHIPGEVFDTAVGTTGTKDAVITRPGLSSCGAAVRAAQRRLGGYRGNSGSRVRRR